MIRRGSRPESHFLMVRNEVVRDARLSYRARGLLMFILSYPDAWSWTSRSLSSGTLEGRDAVLTALRELRDAGYARTVRERDDQGRLRTVTVIFDAPETGEPNPDYPDPVKPDRIEDCLTEDSKTLLPVVADKPPMPVIVREGAVDATEPSGGLVMRGILERLSERPPSRVVGVLAREAGVLVREGFPVEVIVEAGVQVVSRGLHPSCLASEVSRLRVGGGSRMGGVLGAVRELVKEEDAW